VCYFSFRSLGAPYVKAVSKFRRFPGVCETDGGIRPIFGRRSGSGREGVERSLSDGRGTLLTSSSAPSATLEPVNRHTCSSGLLTFALNVVTTTYIAGLEQLQYTTLQNPESPSYMPDTDR
jgi:hypothetical protein